MLYSRQVHILFGLTLKATSEILSPSHLQTQQTTFNSIIEGKDKLIEQQQGLIDGYKAALLDANQKLKTMEYDISDNKRKIDGLQRAVNNEISERKAAEKNICFVYDCELRRPKRGTYKKETA